MKDLRAGKVVMVKSNPQSLIGVVRTVQPKSEIFDSEDPNFAKAPDVLVGVALNDPKGNCDGTSPHNGKRFFKVQGPKYGLWCGPSAIQKIIKPMTLLKQLATTVKQLKESKVKISELEDQVQGLLGGDGQRGLEDGLTAEANSRPESQAESVDSQASKYVKTLLSKNVYISRPDFVHRYLEDGQRLAKQHYDPQAEDFEKNWDAAGNNNSHTRIVYAVASSPRDSLIASGADDKTVKFWRLGKNKSQQALRPVLNMSIRSSVNALSFQPSGNTLAAAMDSGWIELFDVERGQMIGALEGQTTSEVWCLCWSPDGNVLISGALDRAVRIWDFRERECKFALRGHDEWVNGVAVSSDGQTIVSGSGDKTIRMWDPRQMSSRATMTGHTDFVRSVCVTHDDKHVVSASDDTNIRVWDIQTGRAESILSGHSKGIYSVSAAISGGKSCIASASRDTTVKIWDVSNVDQAKNVRTFNQHQGDVNAVSWVARDSYRYVVSGSDDKSVRLWDVRKNE